MGRRPIDSGPGYMLGFVGALEAMAVSGRSGNVRRGRGQAARQKGGGATYFDLNTGRYGQFFEHVYDMIPGPPLVFKINVHHNSIMHLTYMIN